MNARADIIMLDTSVLRDIARGNSQAAEALIRRIKSGARVYVSRLAYRELVLDAPTPELRQQWRLLLKDAKISEDDERKGLETVQKTTDDHVKQIDELQKKKDAELLGH